MPAAALKTLPKPPRGPSLGAFPAAAESVRRSMVSSRRSQYQFLSWLTVQELERYLDEADRGNYTRLQVIFRLAEKRWGTLRGLKARRLAAIGKLDWDILKKDDSRAARRQAAELRAVFDNIENLKTAFQQMALAEFRKFSHHQIITDGDGWPVRLDFVPQEHWRRDGAYGEWRYCAKGEADPGVPLSQLTVAGADGSPVSPTFIIREVEDPLNELAAILWLPRMLGRVDWNAFIEQWANPSGVVLLPPNVPEASMAQWLEAAEKISGGSAGVLPAGADFKPIQTGEKGDVFTNFFREIDAELVLAGTGGKLSMLTEATGMGSGASKTQDDAFNDLAIAEAAEISEILDKAIAKPWLQWAFPGEPPLVWFQIKATDETDAAAQLDQVKALQDKWDMDAAEVSERLGWKLSRKSAAAPAAVPVANARPAPALPEISQLMADAWANLVKVMQDTGTPALQAAAGLAAAEAPTPQAALEVLDVIESAEMPPALADAWESFHAAALLAGWEQTDRLNPQ